MLTSRRILRRIARCGSIAALAAAWLTLEVAENRHHAAASIAVLARRRLVRAGNGGAEVPEVGVSSVALQFYDPNNSAADYGSSPMLLKPGMLSAEQFDAGYGRLEADGVEIDVYAERMYGRHADDDSLRQVLYQWDPADVRSASSIVFYPDRLRTKATRSEQPVTRAYLQAPLVLLPTSAEYICETDVCFGPLVARGSEGAIHADYTTITSALAAYGDGAWSLSGVTAWPAATTYDHCLAVAMEWCETANPATWWRAMQLLDAFVDAATPLNDAIANPDNEYGTNEWVGGSLPAHRRMMYSVAWGYAVTGHAQMRRTVLATAHLHTIWVNPDYRLQTDDWSFQLSEPRTAMALLPALVLSILLEAENNTAHSSVGGTGASENWRYRLNSLLDFYEETIRPAASPLPYCAGVVYSNKDYSGGDPVEPGQFPTYMLGITCSDLIAAYRYGGKDSRLPTWLDTMATFVRNQLRPVDPSADGYVVGQTTTTYNVSNPATLGSTIATENHAILSLMFGELFGFLGHKDADANRLTDLTFVVRSANTSSYLGGAVWKFYSEQKLYSSRGMGYHKLALAA